MVFLHEGPVQGHITEKFERAEIKPSIWQYSNLQPLGYVAYGLMVFYNHCPNARYVSKGTLTIG